MLIIALFLIPVMFVLFLWAQGSFKGKAGRSAVLLNAQPDTPVSFGYKTRWIAVRNTSPEDLIQSLNTYYGLQFQPEIANWQSGLRATHDGHGLFITPPVGDWVLLVGADLPDISEPNAQRLMQTLSARFGEAHFFGNHRVSGYGAFGLYRQGACIRALSVADGDIFLNEGAVTEAEQNIIRREYPDILAGHETDEHALVFMSDDAVLEMAAQYSIDPQQLSEMNLAGTGLFIGDGKFDTW